MQFFSKCESMDNWTFFYEQLKVQQFLILLLEWKIQLFLNKWFKLNTNGFKSQIISQYFYWSIL